MCVGIMERWWEHNVCSLQNLCNLNSISQGLGYRIVEFFNICSRKLKWIKLVTLSVFLFIALKTFTENLAVSIMLKSVLNVHLLFKMYIEYTFFFTWLKQGFSVNDLTAIHRNTLVIFMWSTIQIGPKRIERGERNDDVDIVYPCSM